MLSRRTDRKAAAVRLFDNPGGTPVRLERLEAGDPTAAVNVPYRPVRH
jgi:hypothetical protein